METILFKGGGYTVFSNMAAYAIEFEGKLWMTSEHAYQAMKFHDETIKDLIREARSGYEAKMLSITHEKLIQDDWNEKRLGIMEKIIRAKLKQHSHVKKKLLDSGDALLVENTEDIFWGRGTNNDGRNELGKLWMKLRAELSSYE